MYLDKPDCLPLTFLAPSVFFAFLGLLVCIASTNSDTVLLPCPVQPLVNRYPGDSPSGSLRMMAFLADVYNNRETMIIATWNFLFYYYKKSAHGAPKFIHLDNHQKYADYQETNHGLTYGCTKFSQAALGIYRFYNQLRLFFPEMRRLGLLKWIVKALHGEFYPTATPRDHWELKLLLRKSQTEKEIISTELWASQGSLSMHLWVIRLLTSTWYLSNQANSYQSLYSSIPQHCILYCQRSIVRFHLGETK